ncbi:DUF1330 domain-containing protein [Stappia sp. ES.058]|uniref:DUF1330 domain-containing protein n=1 Tax=Stappia sp. ES.058 TaxID=1881061 RepID=UPI00087D6926|nr:DUF1330 domain-containing protein [Stappia sp. ES.058]SDU18752.1 Uncharacterized conserved protein, DUF1330 family [Stappia sp. ES.058]
MANDEEKCCGYWIVQGDPVSDETALAEYGQLWGPVAQRFGAKMIAASETPETVEGPGPGRVVVVRFPSYQAAQDCYHSSAYQEAARFGRKAGRRTLVIVKGAADAV